MGLPGTCLKHHRPLDHPFGTDDTHARPYLIKPPVAEHFGRRFLKRPRLIRPTLAFHYLRDVALIELMDLIHLEGRGGSTQR